MADLTEVLWRFVRRDLTTHEFEQWLYDSADLESFLGRDRYLELISADYNDLHAIYIVRTRLREWLDPAGEHGCSCVEWQTRQILPLGSETANLLEEEFQSLRERTPWLEIVRCQQCEQHWYVAVDTVDDDYYFLRLSDAEVAGILERDEWPTDFDQFAHVWPGPDLSGPVHHPWRDS